MYTELVKSMSTTDSSNINDFLMFDGDNYIAWIIWHERNLAK